MAQVEQLAVVADEHAPCAPCSRMTRPTPSSKVDCDTLTTPERMTSATAFRDSRMVVTLRARSARAIVGKPTVLAGSRRPAAAATTDD